MDPTPNDKLVLFALKVIAYGMLCACTTVMTHSAFTTIREIHKQGGQ